MKLVRKSILPLVMILLIAVLGKYIYMVDGQIDMFRLCMVYGVPFGVPYMLIVLPVGGSISKGIGFMAFGVIIGAMIGCVVAAFYAVRAVAYLMWFVASRLVAMWNPKRVYN